MARPKAPGGAGTPPEDPASATPDEAEGGTAADEPSTSAPSPGDPQAPESKSIPSEPTPKPAPLDAVAEAAYEAVRTAGGIIGWAIRRPVTITVGVVLLGLFGVLSVLGLPIQLTPDITVPTISIATAWPGSTPVELETDVVEAQEEALKSLPGLVSMKTEVRGGQATINLELAVGASLQEALVRVNNLLSQVADYPDSVRQPVVSTADSTGPPLAVLVMQDPKGGPVSQYGTYMREVVVPRLERVNGVASIRTIGGQEQEVHVDFDPARLAARGLTVGTVAARLRAELRDISAGDIPLGKRRYLVRTEVAPADPTELAETVLAVTASGTPIRLRDVGQVSMGLRKADAVGLVNGTPSIALLMFREAGSNVLEVTREIRAVAEEVQETLLAPEGLELRIVSDQVGYIEGALKTVQDNLVVGAILAVVVLLLFLRSFAASVVVAMAIPICVVGAALGMSLAGRTVNIVSLAGMAFAVGMVVDNSIVVLESIDTWRDRAKNVATAALAGTQEVWGAILASTLTTIAVFIPILTWQDEVGELLRDVAVAISVSVVVSLVVSVLVIPSFAALLLRKRKARAREEDEEVRGIAAALGRFIRLIVGGAVRAPLLSAGALAFIAWLGIVNIPPMEYLPTGNRDVVFGAVIPPPGYSVDEIEAIGRSIQGQLLPHLKKETDGQPALDRMFFFGGPDSAFMGAVGENADRMPEIVQMLRKAQLTVPGAFSFASQAALFGRRLGGGRAVEIDLLSSDLVGTILFAQKLMGAISAAIPGVQVRPIPGLDLGAAEFRVRPDRVQASAVGLSPVDIGLVVDAYVDGSIIGELGVVGEPKRDVLLRAMGVRLDDPEQLITAPVPVPGGRFVPLGELASVMEYLGPTILQHIERRRGLTLQVTPPDEVALETAVNTLRDEIVRPMLQAGGVPPDLTAEFSGTAGQLEDAQGRLGIALLLAVVICYLLLSALFENFLAPLAIMISVPMAGTGGILGLKLVNATLNPQPLDMMTALGFIILIGVVVNNAILVVDGALARLRSGLDLVTATADAVQRRVRPIAMTTLTSLAGLMPLVIVPGPGSELYRGVGAVVLGGLALATLLTLFLVPTVFVTLWRLRALFTKKALAAPV